ncbi:MAG: bifunctional folylpolyglutamate synthase/dihydrofolate synthase [Actinomycetota bacterium]
MTTSRFVEAVGELDARGPGRMIPDLDRIRALTELLDHPELAFPSVQVTGTNGKTTTARLVTRILCAHGLSAGVYTSPHLRSVTERLMLCDEPIGEVEFAETHAHLTPYLAEVDARGESVTYFEALTAMAYLWFADKPVDVGVFEVGMGGTWDATNLVRGEIGIVTPIGLDHPELGSTLAEVATEKAGIIKPGATAVVREQRPDSMEVLTRRSAEVGATVVLEGREFELSERDPAVGGQRIALRGFHDTYDDLFLPLHGEHQSRNAAAAVASCEVLLGRALNHDALREALGAVESPGRLEVVSRHPLVVLDGAHNPDAAQALATAIGDAFSWQRLHLVIGILETKDGDAIAAALASRADTVYACANSNAKSRSGSETADICRRAGMSTAAYETVGGALDVAEAAADEADLILVTGSLYTVADARPRYVT